MSNKAATRDHRGQALVEMAFACLMFLFVFFGIIEFSRALYTYNTIVQSTRAAARWAVVNVGSDADTADKDRTRNIVVYGDPDISSGSPILSGLTTSLVDVSVQTIESDSKGSPISQKISVKVSGFQFTFALPIAGTLTLPAFETSLYTESMGVVPT
jgi:Flp pilus assembly protein TadG